jgi:ectoine hydroxylase-related dioxygenase (phytanoyl-CoA dioxygenase family)
VTTAPRRERFERDGYVVVEGLLGPDEIAWYWDVYDRLLSGEIDAGVRRGDLGAAAERRQEHVENITQIMWPSDLVEGLRESAAYERARAVAREVLGDDVVVDFDMLIDKAPGTDTPTPWHQDWAYWPDLPDRRAASCWIALDRATVESGCMWFLPGSHREPLRPHRSSGPGGALECDPPDSGAVAVPLEPGSCTFHDGGMLHYSRGNTTAGHRRALIVNLRPRAMVEYERARGIEHGRRGPGRDNLNPLTR